jgi:2-oxoglutarate dehydrogenase E2 component (dihydrolipoamide succinyltransferase)
MADVVMPQMGESIAEGTIVRWIKKVGDRVERDEPLFEISTDKVDAEIPSPSAGVLSEIRAREGETVPINTVVALISDEGQALRPAPEHGARSGQAGQAGQAGGAGRAGQAESARGPREESESSSAAARASGDGAPLPADNDQRTSPLVRRIAKEHNVDLSKVRGTGLGGRVTKDDILAFIGQGASASPDLKVGPAAPTTAPTASSRTATPVPPVQPARLAGAVPMSVMRKKIAEHMIASRRTSAHVHSVFEVNFTKVAAARQARKAEFEKAGARLTYLTFILKAVTSALRAVPIVNASVEGDTIVYHEDVNVGIAVALDWGLIVPVVRQADRKDLLELSRSVADLADRARRKLLKPDDVTGGTFTITNPGVFGALFGMPIIHQPQVAILGVGAVEKRAVVIDDAIAIRSMAYLSLGYDHRIIDGAVADQFLAHIKQDLENWAD